MEKVDLTITHFNDCKTHYYDVKADLSHPQVLIVTFNEGYIRLLNYKIIKELYMEPAVIV